MDFEVITNNIPTEKKLILIKELIESIPGGVVANVFTSRVTTTKCNLILELETYDEAHSINCIIKKL